MSFFPTAANECDCKSYRRIYLYRDIGIGRLRQSHHVCRRVFTRKVLLVVGVVLLSWFLIEIQAQQNRHLMETNRRLFIERAYVQNLLESMTDGVIAFDINRKVTTINTAARDILQIPANLRLSKILDKIPAAIMRSCQYYFQSEKETTDEILEDQASGWFFTHVAAEYAWAA